MSEFKKIKEEIWASWKKPYWQANDPIIAIGFLKSKDSEVWGRPAQYWVDQFIKYSGSWNNQEAREIKYRLLELMKDEQREENS